MIIDILKYFGKFPAKTAILDIFSRGRSDLPAYAVLKTYFENAPVHSLIPEIEGFLFGENEDSVKTHVGKLHGIYLFVDYGDLSSSRNAKNSIEDDFQMALTIAMKLPEAYDQVECAIASEECLKHIITLIQIILDDQKEVSWLKELSNNYTIIPFDSKNFSSYGWTLQMNRKGADMLNIKNIE